MQNNTNLTLSQYSKFAPYYKAIGEKRGHFDAQTMFLKNILKCHSSESYTILDASCGTGNVLLNLSEIFPNYKLFGTDGCPEFVLQANRLVGSKSINIQCTEWLNLRNVFEPNKFDLIYILGNSIGHASSINEFSQILSIIKTLLKDGGSFIFDLRTWSDCDNNKSFNEPYIKENFIYLTNLKYTTEYYFKNRRHYLVHRIYNGDKLVTEIKLSFFAYSRQEIDDIIISNGFYILERAHKPQDYPFLSYKIRKCK
ncbi:MAG: class I SAM-dependent methyltransferase [Bacteroidales bacterium]|nr:class I SAM-dependent methyltransferase [Bacteroidales bacterium]